MLIQKALGNPGMLLRRSNSLNAKEKRKRIVFFDFDNTITPSDVLDDIIKQFAIDDKWVAYEESWAAGKIGSKECLEGQLRSLRVTKRKLSHYLSTIEIDPSFARLLELLKRKKISSVIVSDSFSFIIKEILRHSGVRKTKIYANKLNFRNDKLIPSFPYLNQDCSRCAHCKKRHIFEHSDKITIYVGDGLSDICPAEHANVVFAKNGLLDHLRKRHMPCFEFKQLEDVLVYFEEMATEGQGKKVYASV